MVQVSSAINEQWLANAKRQAVLLDGLPVRFHNWDCVLRCGHYAEGRIAIELVSTTTEEPAAIATVNVPELNGILADDQVFIKDYAENEGILAALVGAAILEPTGNEVEVGLTKAKVARLLPERDLGVRQMDSRSLLLRVALGVSDRADAEQLKGWLYPDDQGQTVKSYLWLMNNYSTARRFIAKDFRLSLAAWLTANIAESAARSLYHACETSESTINEIAVLLESWALQLGAQMRRSDNLAEMANLAKKLREDPIRRDALAKADDEYKAAWEDAAAWDDVAQPAAKVS